MDPELPKIVLICIVALILCATLIWLMPRFAKSLMRLAKQTRRTDDLLTKSEADQRRASAILDLQEALMMRVEQALERLERNLPKS